MAKQTFTTGQVLTAAQMTSLQQTAMGGGSPQTKTASYTLVAADAGTVIQMNSASATTITVNTALFSAGDSVQIQNIGAGTCTITAGTATVNSAGSLGVTQYDGGFLYFSSTSSAIWFDYTQAGTTSPLTTKGDLYTRTSSADARLPVGTNGQTLVADSSEATGLKWAAAGGGGKVLQVVEGSYSTQTDNSTTTYQDTNLTATITPSATTSKILVIAKHIGYKAAGNAGNALYIQLLRGATKIDETITSYTNSSLDNYDEITLLKLDSPSTTSATTYKTQFKNGAAAVQVSVQVASMPSQIILMEIGA